MHELELWKYFRGTYVVTEIGIVGVFVGLEVSLGARVFGLWAARSRGITDIWAFSAEIGPYVPIRHYAFDMGFEENTLTHNHSIGNFFKIFKFSLDNNHDAQWSRACHL